jgi:hypothetical protein
LEQLQANAHNGRSAALEEYPAAGNERTMARRSWYQGIGYQDSIRSHDFGARCGYLRNRDVSKQGVGEAARHCARMLGGGEELVNDQPSMADVGPRGQWTGRRGRKRPKKEGLTRSVLPDATTHQPRQPHAPHRYGLRLVNGFSNRSSPRVRDRSARGSWHCGHGR